ncbi:hypothetical protein OIE63_14645 [Streptomyces sp. NBC_01795]|uniref:hypothetical protein n=1 Tax=Streptomyces sp. NBC_01795 TaxID=2975943 RepID=UPI002DD805C8|nr:hypothetical protein [Streptomyces sp. NBC_01795]WSA92665.1 hypothetical protein OIE63_14645 [Streptomyces sp. NBC_01795]
MARASGPTPQAARRPHGCAAGLAGAPGRGRLPQPGPRSRRYAAPDGWRRQVALLLDGLRTEAAQGPLPVAPLTPQQTYALMGGLAGTP